MSESDRNEIDQAASQVGIPTSRWIRELCLAAARSDNTKISGDGGSRLSRHALILGIARRRPLLPLPGIEPEPGPSESPVQSATSKNVRRPIGRAKDIRDSLHLQEPITGFAPACFPKENEQGQDGRLSQSSHVGSQHEREDSNPIQRLWRPPALPGARSCKAAEPSEKDSAAIVIHPTRRSSTPR